MQLCLGWRAFVITTAIPFEHELPRWSIIPGNTLNILLWIQARPMKDCNWLDLLKTGQPVVFEGIEIETGNLITRTVNAEIRKSRQGHGRIWALSFS